MASWLLGLGMSGLVAGSDVLTFGFDHLNWLTVYVLPLLGFGLRYLLSRRFSSPLSLFLIFIGTTLLWQFVIDPIKYEWAFARSVSEASEADYNIACRRPLTRPQLIKACIVTWYEFDEWPIVIASRTVLNNLLKSVYESTMLRLGLLMVLVLAANWGLQNARRWTANKRRAKLATADERTKGLVDQLLQRSSL